MKLFFALFPCMFLLLFSDSLYGQQSTYLSMLNYTVPAGAKADFKRTGNGFILRTFSKRTKQIIVSARFWHPAAAQQKLALKITGASGNKKAKLRPVLFYRKGTEEIAVSASPIRLDNPEPQEYIFGLDTDFGLSDAVFNFCRLDLILEPPELSGSEFTLENARIANQEELSRRSEPYTVISPVYCRKNGSSLLTPVKIYFEWDNDDLAPKPLNGFIRFQDRTQKNTSYSALLLENTNGLFQQTPSPAEADIIVYARTEPSGRAAEIRKAIQNGKKLIVYGTVPDTELKPFLPLELSKRNFSGFAEKMPLAYERHPFFYTAERNALYGQYFNASLKHGTTLVSFTDGTPFLAQNKYCIQIAGGPGNSFLPSTVFHDKSLLRMALPSEEYSTELDRIEQKILTQKQVQEKEQLERILDSAGILPADRAGFRKGTSFDNFGRFGWRIGAHLQIDSIRDDLSVSNGSQNYRFPDGDKQLAVSEISWTGKTYRIAGTAGERIMTFSLLSPFILYRFPGSKTISFTEESNADSAAFKTEKGVQTIPLDSQNTILYNRKRDGRWNAPWLLLFRKNESAPLLLVFSSNPDEVKYKRTGNSTVFTIRNRQMNTSLAIGWLYGKKRVQTRGWEKALPEATVSQVERSLNFALNFPVGCDELFRINRKKRNVELLHTIRYLRVKDEWNTPVENIAVLPPLIAFAADEKFAKVPERLTDFNIATVYGPLRGIMGTNSIRFSLPMAPVKDLIPVGVRDKELNKAQNEYFKRSSGWSARRTRLEDWTPRKPSTFPDIRNIDVFAWNFGMGTALQGALSLSPENRNILANRARIRYLEPLELYQYRNFARHREEPFSGLCYPVLFNSVFPNSTNFAPGTGSSVNYGDCNEACTVSAWIGQQLADRFGQSDIIRRNWNYYRYMMRYQKHINDYSFLTGSCRETGIGSWVDMLNAEMCGELAYVRLAEIAGDKDERDLALCRAAKKAVPTILRFRFRNYLETLSPSLKKRNDIQITGFSEEGAKIMFYPIRNYNFLVANELFDFSQGLHGSLYWLYRENVLPEVKEYLEKRALPSLFPKGKNLLRSDYLQVLALFGKDNFPFRSHALDIAARDPGNSKSDWGGIRYPFHFALALWRLHLQIALSEYKNLDLKYAWYEPAKRTFELEFDAGEDSILVFTSGIPPKTSVRNGKPIILEQTGKEYRLPIEAGRNHWSISF